jgi:hypothetical protein
VTPARVGATGQKYHAIPTHVDGHRFASRREARRYGELRLQARAGAIRDLELQPAYVLHAPVVNPAGAVIGLRRIGSYIGDFRYRNRAGAVVVEDAKGVRTPLYRWKCKMVDAEYGIQIQEV